VVFGADDPARGAVVSALRLADADFLNHRVAYRGRGYGRTMPPGAEKLFPGEARLAGSGDSSHVSSEQVTGNKNFRVVARIWPGGGGLANSGQVL
jgi:hypothetical protein